MSDEATIHNSRFTGRQVPLRAQSPSGDITASYSMLPLLAESWMLIADGYSLLLTPYFLLGLLG